MYLDFVDYKVLENYLDFGGIRLEDDFLITATGSRLLGDKLPTSSQEIEDFRKSKIRL